MDSVNLRLQQLDVEPYSRSLSVSTPRHSAVGFSTTPSSPVASPGAMMLWGTSLDKEPGSPGRVSRRSLLSSQLRISASSGQLKTDEEYANRCSGPLPGAFLSRLSCSPTLDVDAAMDILESTRPSRSDSQLQLGSPSSPPISIPNTT